MFYSLFFTFFLSLSSQAIEFNPFIIHEGLEALTNDKLTESFMGECSPSVEITPPVEEANIECYSDENEDPNENEVEVIQSIDISYPYLSQNPEAIAWEKKAYQLLQLAVFESSAEEKEKLRIKAKKYLFYAQYLDSLLAQYPTLKAKKEVLKAFSKFVNLENILDSSERKKSIELMKMNLAQARLWHQVETKYRHKKSQKIYYEHLINPNWELSPKEKNQISKYEELAVKEAEADKKFDFSLPLSKQNRADKNLAAFHYVQKMAPDYMKQGEFEKALLISKPSSLYLERFDRLSGQASKLEEKRQWRVEEPTLNLYRFERGNYLRIVDGNDNLGVGAVDLLQQKIKSLNIDGPDNFKTHSLDFEIGTNELFKKSQLNLRLKQEGTQYTQHSPYELFRIGKEKDKMKEVLIDQTTIIRDHNNLPAFGQDREGNIWSLFKSTGFATPIGYERFIFREVTKTSLSIDNYAPDKEVFFQLGGKYVKYNSMKDPKGFFSPANQQAKWHNLLSDNFSQARKIIFDYDGKDQTGFVLDVLIGFQKQLKVNNICRFNAHSSLNFTNSNIDEETGVTMEAGLSTLLSSGQKQRTHFIFDTDYLRQSTFTGEKEQMDTRLRMERKRSSFALGIIIPLSEDTTQGEWNSGHKNVYGTISYTYRLVKKMKSKND